MCVFFIIGTSYRELRIRLSDPAEMTHSDPTTLEQRTKNMTSHKDTQQEEEQTTYHHVWKVEIK